MASQVEEVNCVLRFHESVSAVTAQREFKGKSPGTRPVTDAQMGTVRAAFVRSPRTSTKHVASQK